MALSPTSSRGSSGGGSIAVTDGSTTVTPATTLDFTAGVVVTDAGSGQANASVTGGAPTFSPTTTKTANYTTAAGEYVVGDSTGGAFTVTLPAAPANGSLVAVQNIGTGNAITVAAGAGDTLNATTNSSLGTTRRSGLYEYRASDKVWIGIAPATNPVLSAGAFDGSIVAHGTSSAVTFSTGTLDALAAAQPPTGAVALNAQKITGLAAATAATDAASLANRLDQFAVPTAAVVLNSQPLTGAQLVAIAGGSGAAAATRIIGANASGAPASGTWNTGDVAVGQNGHLFVCTSGGTPGTWVDAGSASNPNLATVLGVGNSAGSTKITNLAAGTAAADAIVTAQIMPTASFLSGRYTKLGVVTNSSGGLSGQTFTQNSMYVWPFVVQFATTIVRLGVNVQTTVASSTARLGIYNDNGAGQPGTLVVDAGTVDTHTATGFVEATISTLLNPGVYWGAVAPQGANATLYAMPLDGMSRASGAVAASFPIAVYIVASVSGALPSPAGTMTDGIGFAPSMTARI